jgi:hypothetical protein
MRTLCGAAHGILPNGTIDQLPVTIANRVSGDIYTG